MKILIVFLTILSLILPRQNLGRFVLQQDDSSSSFPLLAAQKINTTVTSCINRMPKTITISFVGDCMIASSKGVVSGNNFAATALKEKPEYFLKNVAPIFKADDFTVANLECVLTDRNLSEVPKRGTRKFWFKAPTSNIKILTSGGVDIVSLGNNHTNDYGTQGFKDSIDIVEKSKLTYGTYNKVARFEKYGIKFSMICCGLWAPYSAQSALQTLNAEKEKSDYQIIYFHGGTEGIHMPEDWKVSACHKFVDNGADLVVGGHPHVLQPIEMYKDVPIVYSLGNFCYGGHTLPENKTMIYQARIQIQNQQIVKTSSNVIPCYVYTGRVNNWQPGIIEDEKDKQSIFSILNTPVLEGKV